MKNLSEKRVSGEIFVKRFCEKFGIDMNFSLVFSANVEITGTNIIKLTNINPYHLYRIFPQVKELFMFVKYNSTPYVITVRIKKVDTDHILAEIKNEEIYKDKRRFHRFYFCCKDIGDFSIEKNGKIITKSACIQELSRGGAGILNPEINTVKEGDIIRLENFEDELSLEVKILYRKPKGKFDILGGEIINSNKNLINYVIKKYIKVSKDLIEKAG
ncbi:hypothetical protein [Persephonella sp. KM09-Lau-8]|uniref:hypothetical protein n=1 Tax=Persephonella sp. KM09-Lau-8 TaxID=1158345 RepID=UPI0004962A01|nr:hypothetical protein [Persephonella sp. KM09-Lau-8]